MKKAEKTMWMIAAALKKQSDPNELQ